ncbi:MAG: hypothetical protein V3T39_02190 [Gammaproteobacteria bacterium]
MFRILVTLILLLPTAALAETYGECRSRLLVAYQASDFKTMATVANECLSVRPDYPGMLYNLALAQTLAGNTDAAMQTLFDLAERSLVFDISAEPFASLAEHPRHVELVQRFEVISAAFGTATIAFEYDERDFVPEGIAFDERDGTLYLGSIHKSKIIHIQANGVQTLFASAFQWSVFGMRIDPQRDELWVATAAIAQGTDTPEQELGETAILRYSLRNGSLLRRYPLHRSNERGQVLGDLILIETGIYTTDSLSGAVYRLDPTAGKYETIVATGKLHSPQGLVASADNKYLYIADYTGGLFRLNLDNHELHRVSAPANSVLYGIDGLYRHGNDLIAIQNGIQPHRVTRIELNETGDAVTATEILASGLNEFDEPTLGQVVEHDLLLVANSHWNRFNAENQLVNAKDLAGPIILRINLE